MTIVQYLQLLAVALLVVALVANRLGDWHGMRRRWFALFGNARRGKCVECGRRLTHGERRYYGCTCERCERAHSDETYGV